MMKTEKYNLLLLISFFNGMGLMAFELVAARLLAPTIGSSTYIWTSVIGVIIAMLALGSWLGGRVADNRNKFSDIALLLLTSAATIAFTTTFSETILQYLMQNKLDPRMTGVLASLMLFAPASFTIGFTGPYLAKLNIKSLDDSGRSVANLDSLHSVGGIIGTFVTGFLLFSIIGSRSILIILILTFVLLSWLITPRVHFKFRTILSTIIVFIAIFYNFISNDIHIDTPSAHYVISDTSPGDINNMRLLITGPGGFQSGILTEDPDELVFWYSQKIAVALQKAPKKNNILILGGGAYTMPRYLAKEYPDAKIDVVEIDPQLVGISIEHFSYSKAPNVVHVNADARTYINATNKTYDVIVADVYSDSSVPFTMLTKEYGQGIKRISLDDTVVIANIIADDAISSKCLDFFKASLAPYADNFKNGSYLKQSAGLSNIIATFTDNDDYYTADGKKIPSLSGFPRYADDFAPVESLQFRCK